MKHYVRDYVNLHFLLKGMKIEIIDERNDEQDVFHYENGIEAFVEYLNEEKDALHPVV